MKTKIVLLMFLLVFSGGGIAMAHSGMVMPSTSSNSMPGMNMSGGVMQVTETPENLKILGTFGAVNLAFIIIGIWGKWFRRKEGPHVNSK